MTLVWFREWPAARSLLLVLICLGGILVHHAEAAVEPDHVEHCGVCATGCHTPALGSEVAGSPVVLPGEAFLIVPTSLIVFPRHWPNYIGRAPPRI